MWKMQATSDRRPQQEAAVHWYQRATLAASVGASIAALIVTAMPGAASAVDSLPNWPNNPDWQSLVPAPSSTDVHPIRIVRTNGSVTNPEALTGGAGSTTLTVTPGRSNAVVVLDYGREVGGLPYVNAASSAPSGTSNNLRISTSEALGFLNTNKTSTLALAGNAGDTNLKVASVTPFWVGTSVTVDTGAAAETRNVTAVGTAAAPNTSLVLPAVAGDTNAKVGSVTGYIVGAPITIDTGSAAEIATITNVGTAATATQLFSAATAGDTNVKVTTTSGLTAGAQLYLDPGSNQEAVTISSVGTAGVNSTVAAANTISGLQVPTYAASPVANWIWNVAGAGTNAPGPIYVRKDFTVANPAAITSAVLRINADDSAVVYVNGTSLGQTTTGSNGWRTSMLVDIAPYLVAGNNVVAIQGVNSDGGGSLIAALELHDGSVTRYVTDSSWKALAGTPAAPPSGWNTAAFDDSSWQAATISGAYGVSPWGTSVTEPAGPTTLKVASVAGFAVGDQVSIDTGANQETATVAAVGSAGANGSGLTLTAPLTIVHNANAPVLDVSKPGTGINFTPALTQAHAALSSAASPGTGISFTPALGNAHAAGATVASSGTGISLDAPLSNAHAAGAPVIGQGTYANDNGSQINFTVTAPNTYTSTSLRGGFRFEAIELTTPGTLTLSSAGLNFKAYLATPDKYQGWFMSSDDQLNKIWYAGAYTTQMDMVPVGVAPCFQVPVIFDGAKRDRAIWSGDLMVTDPVALLSLGTNAAPYVTGSIDSIMNLQDATGRLTSAVGFRGCGAFNYAITYSAYSAIIAVQYYRYTGDRTYITNLLPKLEAATAFSASTLDANGLVVTNDNDYWQTRQTGEVTEYSLAYYELLQNMIWLEQQVGNTNMVATYTADAASLRDAINLHLFNASAGLYQWTDSQSTIFPLDANMNAVRLGVAPADNVQGILDYFKAHWPPHGDLISRPDPSLCDPSCHTIEPLNNTWEMMARFQSNDASDALALLRSLWGVEVDPNSGFYTGTFWEFNDSNGLPTRGFDSLAHGWAAGPTQLLTEGVLGATPVGAGFSTWRVQPQPGNLAWAEGVLPTANGGSLSVRWAQDTGAGTFHLQVVAPAGSSGEVWVPLSSATTSISLPTSPGATFVRRDGNYDVYTVGSGTFEFSAAPVTFASLEKLVAYFSTNPSVTSGLNDKLAAAAAAKTSKVRDNQLDAFVQQVKSQTGKALAQEEAQVLITLSAALR